MGGGCAKEKTESEEQKQKIDSSRKPFDAGRVEDFSKNEIKEVKITPEFTVLVSEYDGHFYAYGSKCPHYGAPLAKGSLLDGLIRCPWHGASFDIRTGEIEDYPGLDCIPSYPVTKGHLGKLTVHIRPNSVGTYKVERPLVGIKESEELTIIIGAGASGLTCAQTLREVGYDGRLLMISKDSYLPYDRTKLSKVLGAPWESVKLRDEDWFKKAQIEVMLNAEVSALDVEEQQVFIEGMDEPLDYHKLVLATGMKPRVPLPTKNGVIGSDLKNVLSLYDLRDSRKIKDKCSGKTVVIMGAGFIAMELLGPLSSIATQIYVIHRSKRPYGQVLGDTVGRLVQQTLIRKHKKKVVFVSCDAIKQIYGNGNKEVVKLTTMKNRELKCDVVIFATGGIPNTGFVMSYKSELENDGFKLPEEAGLGINQAGHIPVNEFMETHLVNHFACGDIVRFPSRYSIASSCQLGHWGLAQKMGRTTAFKMMGRDESIFNTVPFFWTNVGGMTIRYVGYGEHYNHSVIFGDLKSLKFCVLYKRGWKILAGCTCNADPIAARLSFDIQDNVHYEDKYPEYITEIFKAPPIVGDSVFGMKYLMEDDVDSFDFVTHMTKRSWVPRRQKKFKHASYDDIEYMNKPLMSEQEKMVYRNSQHLPPSFFSKKDLSMEYDPVRINFQRLQLYKDTRFHFLKDFTTLKSQKTEKPLYWG